ncbi:hypothetical protein [Sphingomonas sp. R86520]
MINLETGGLIAAVVVGLWLFLRPTFGAARSEEGTTEDWNCD